jgi:NAD(P)-dependent dehydrogenase (short-subunit alcohol dehydrogenase family)
MDLGLSNQHVVITGGSKGIGLECAELFREEFAKVTVVARSNADYTVDLSQRHSVAELFKRIEIEVAPIDILVNCAGTVTRTPAQELTEDNWHQAMDDKFFTYIHGMNAVLPLMAQRKRGVIVNVIGISGKFANSVHVAGGSANAALMLATSGLADAYASNGIRIVAVNPGPTNTLQHNAGVVGINEAARMPLGRIAEAREIADAVVYLSSRRASYINGTTVSLDGGLNKGI